MNSRRIIIGGSVLLWCSSVIAGGPPSRLDGQSGTTTRPDPNTANAPKVKQDIDAFIERSLQEIERHRAESRARRERFLAQTRRESALRVKEMTYDSIRTEIGAPPRQWRVIRPRLEEVSNLIMLEKACIRVGCITDRSGTLPAGYRPIPTELIAPAPEGVSGAAKTAAGTPNEKTGPIVGWRWSRPSVTKAGLPLSRTERACEALLDVLENEDATPEQIAQKVVELRALREQARKRLPGARARLREVLTPPQEAILVFKEYLD